jgi:hypothetical protein
MRRHEPLPSRPTLSSRDGRWLAAVRSRDEATTSYSIDLRESKKDCILAWMEKLDEMDCAVRFGLFDEKTVQEVWRIDPKLKMLLSSVSCEATITTLDGTKSIRVVCNHQRLIVSFRNNPDSSVFYVSLNVIYNYFKDKLS